MFCIVPLELQEQAVGMRGSQQTGTGGSSRGRFSFRQQITGLFRPGQSSIPEATSATTTYNQPQVGDDSPPNTRRRSNFYVEPIIKETRYEKCFLYSL